ncbi:MAG: hypothetical protein ABIS50_07460 [Luteolibacter sp.]|uniref:hypothetical protein n=1 Tax=Luteolibacter sp. TaxID=1962973 RepID=UPI003264C1CE
MKTISKLLTAALLVAFTSSAFAAATVKAGPRKGRILEVDAQQAEFFIEKDRTVSIAFYDAAMKAQPVAAQVITATAEAPSGKVKMEFEKKGDLLVSKTPLPEGEHYTIVVQVKTAADAKPKNFRIPMDISECGKCHNPEYACICDE